MTRLACDKTLHPARIMTGQFRQGVLAGHLDGLGVVSMLQGNRRLALRFQQRLAGLADFVKVFV